MCLDIAGKYKKKSRTRRPERAILEVGGWMTVSQKQREIFWFTRSTDTPFSVLVWSGLVWPGLGKWRYMLFYATTEDKQKDEWSLDNSFPPPYFVVMHPWDTHNLAFLGELGSEMLGNGKHQMKVFVCQLRYLHQSLPLRQISAVRSSKRVSLLKFWTGWGRRYLHVITADTTSPWFPPGIIALKKEWSWKWDNSG